MNVNCVLYGHADRFRWTKTRIWLRCDACGRETPGWDVGSAPRALQPAPPRLPAWRVRWDRIRHADLARGVREATW